MSEVPKMFGDRAKCVAGGCKFLSRLAAAGVDVVQAIEAGRQAAALPYEYCHDGVMTSRPDRGGETWQFCGMRHDVQVGALAVAGYTEAIARTRPEQPACAAPTEATVALDMSALEQQP